MLKSQCNMLHVKGSERLNPLSLQTSRLWVSPTDRQTERERERERDSFRRHRLWVRETASGGTPEGLNHGLCVTA